MVKLVYNLATWDLYTSYGNYWGIHLFFGELLGNLFKKKVAPLVQIFFGEKDKSWPTISWAKSGYSNHGPQSPRQRLCFLPCRMVVECWVEWHQKNARAGSHLLNFMRWKHAHRSVLLWSWQLRKRKRTTAVEEDSSDVGDSDLNSDLELDSSTFDHKEIPMSAG